MTEATTDPVFVPLDFPPWIKWGVRRGAKIDYAAKVRAVGEGKRCSWCGKDCPGRRTSWCSDRCSGKFLSVFTWEMLSGYIRERDGACRRCGSAHPGWNQSGNMKRVEHVMARYNWEHTKKLSDGYRKEYHQLREWWEVDHILPVLDGGTDDPANLRLLCHNCHVILGVERRREKKARALGQAVLL